MLAEVIEVLLHKRRVAPNDEHVLRVLLLRSFREIERAGDHHRLVDDHNLVMGDGVLGVDVNGYACAVDEVRRRIADP